MTARMDMSTGEPGAYRLLCQIDLFLSTTALINEMLPVSYRSARFGTSGEFAQSFACRIVRLVYIK